MTALVVAYRGRADILRCLDALAATEYPLLRVVVIDNSSGDGTVELVREQRPEVEVIASSSNLGFAGGANTGIQAILRSRSEASIPGADTRPPPAMIALVNQDCVVSPDWLTPLVELLADDDSVGLAGSCLLTLDGRSVEHLGGIVSVNGMTEHLGRGEVPDPTARPQDVDYVCGALCAFRVDTWVEMGGFNEAYFPAYFEEVDFCFGLRDRGYRVVCVPASVGYHEAAGTLGLDSSQYLRAYHRGRLRFVVNHLAARQGWRRWLLGELAWLARRPGLANLRAAVLAYLRVPGCLWTRSFGTFGGAR